MVDARLPDGSRVNAIIPPLALDGPMHHHPQVLQGPAQRRGPDPVRHRSPPEMVDFLKACVEARLNIVVSGGTGSGKTTLLNVLSTSSPTTSASSPSRTPPSCSCGRSTWSRWNRARPNIEGTGEVTIRDLVVNCPAHAPRPHRRRRVPRRRGAGHAPGHEHRPRRLADHAPRQHPARRPRPPGDDGADGRHGPAGARHPRADRRRPST